MASKTKEQERRRRQFNFSFSLDVQTRWLDNDQYGHLNNSSYYLIADSVNNAYLHDHCGVVAYPTAASTPSSAKAQASDAIGLVISSSAQFFAPTSFPNALRVGVRVVQLGSSSVTYEFGFFELAPSDSKKKSSSLSTLNDQKDQQSLPHDALAAVIVRVTHVFVDRNSRRPLKPMPSELHEGLQKLIVDEFVTNRDEKSKL